jgi:3-phosphoshikimate 1-carboxyvinyltransferase
LTITPVGALKGINYVLPVHSAQVKSAIIFASLYAEGKTEIVEPLPSRDHTERMLSLFKTGLKKQGKSIISFPVKKLFTPKRLFIPADFSSASFFIVLGLILKNSRIVIKNVGINPTRCGLLKVLKRMGGEIKVLNRNNYYEPYGDILINSSHLKGTQIKEEEVPLMIDEIPILCVAASFAKGKTRIWGVKELKVKEADRINSVVTNLKMAGVSISAHKYSVKGREDWMIEIEGRKNYKPAAFKSFSDHRTAMSMIIFGMGLERESVIDNIRCIDKSFPQFISVINSLYE